MSEYQPNEIDFPRIAGALGAVFVAITIGAFGSQRVLRAFSRPTVVETLPPPPPEPRLQPDPADDLRRFRTQENEILTRYAWEDRSKKIVRVPIERAMALLLERRKR